MFEQEKLQNKLMEIRHKFRILSHITNKEWQKVLMHNIKEWRKKNLNTSMAPKMMTYREHSWLTKIHNRWNVIKRLYLIRFDITAVLPDIHGHLKSKIRIVFV